MIRLDAEIPLLTVRVQQAREAVTMADGRLRDAQMRRNAAAARVSTAVLAHAAARPAAAAGPVPIVGGFGGAAPRRRNPEASTRLVQNTLFLLGGLLLGIAAIVFTAVAWAQFGVNGRAALLMGFTAITLAVPPLVLRRGLTATAETFAAVGLLLVLLDGYAAWSVNLFGVAYGSATGYAGAICATTAAVAAGYEALTGLRGPRVAALLMAQPVLPLVVAPLHPSTVGWSFVLAGVAVLDLLVVRWRGPGAEPFDQVLHGLGYALGAAAALGSGVCALSALGTATAPGGAAVGGAALVAAAGVVLAGTLSARSATAQAAAGGLLVLSFALAAGRTVALASAGSAALLVALVVCAIAAAVAGLGRRLPAGVRLGPWIGALIAVGFPAVLALSDVMWAATSTLLAARPILGAEPGAVAGHAGWQLPATVLLLAGGLVVLAPANRRADVVTCGATLVALAVPAGFGLPWWTAPGIDLTVTAAILLLALRATAPLLPDLVPTLPGAAPIPPGAVPTLPGSRLMLPNAATVLPNAASAVPKAASVMLGAGPTMPGAVLMLPGVAAGVLVAHAVATGLGMVATAAATFGAMTLLGIGTAAVAWRAVASGAVASGAVASDEVAGRSGAGGAVAAPVGHHRRGDLAGRRLILGRVAFGVGLLAAPAAGWNVVAVWGAAAPWRTRIALAVLALLVVVARLTARRWAEYGRPAAIAVALSAASVPLWTTRLVVPSEWQSGGESTAIYAASALILIALLPRILVVASVPVVMLATASVALALCVEILGSLVAVLLTPYGWLTDPWGGRPAGTGIGPVSTSDAVAIVLLAAAVVAYQWDRGHRWSAAVRAAGPVAALAAPLMLAGWGLRWPAVPTASLVGGLTVTMFLALREPSGDELRQPAEAELRQPSGDDLCQPNGGEWSDPAEGRVRRPAGDNLIGSRGAGLIGIGLVGAGVAGALPTRGATLAALAAVGIVAAMAGAAGRQMAARIAGWVVSVAAFVGFAFTVGRASGLTTAGAAFGVLAVAAIALAGGTALAVRTALAGGTSSTGGFGWGVRHRVEAVAVQAAGHAGAVTALLLTAGAPRYAAAVCTLWGIALGVRALWSGESTASRSNLLIAAVGAELAGWWLLIAAAQVSLTEAYTLPAAAVALFAGWLRRRAPGGNHPSQAADSARRGYPSPGAADAGPDLSSGVREDSRPVPGSWVAYGPALAAALLPTCATVLIGDGEPWRRLLWGLGALALVLLGARARLRAPVMAGGAALVVLALHEAVLFWDLLPRWIPLAAAGLLLVSVAMTLERRRRDFSRLRGAMARMT